MSHEIIHTTISNILRTGKDSQVESCILTGKSFQLGRHVQINNLKPYLITKHDSLQWDLSRSRLKYHHPFPRQKTKITVTIQIGQAKHLMVMIWSNCIFQIIENLFCRKGCINISFPWFLQKPFLNQMIKDKK